MDWEPAQGQWVDLMGLSWHWRVWGQLRGLTRWVEKLPQQLLCWEWGRASGRSAGLQTRWVDRRVSQFDYLPQQLQGKLQQQQVLQQALQKLLQ